MGALYRSDGIQIRPYGRVLAYERYNCVTRSTRRGKSYVIGKGCIFDFLRLVSVKSGDKIRKMLVMNKP